MVRENIEFIRQFDPEVAEVAQRTVFLRNGKLHKETINENFTGEIKFDK